MDNFNHRTVDVKTKCLGQHF